MSKLSIKQCREDRPREKLLLKVFHHSQTQSLYTYRVGNKEESAVELEVFY